MARVSVWLKLFLVGPHGFCHVEGPGVHGAPQTRREPAPSRHKGFEHTFALFVIKESSRSIEAAGVASSEAGARRPDGVNVDLGEGAKK